MANIYLTMKQLETLFWQSTLLMIGLDPENKANAGKVRLSWPTQGAPAWKVDEDVIFLRITEADDEYNRQRDTAYDPKDKDADNAIEKKTFTRIIQTYWICYGPNSFDRAFAIRNALFATQSRETLSGSGLYLISDMDAPRRSPELFAGQWWERTDLSARFNEYIRLDTTVPYLKSADIAVENSPVSGTTIQTDASVDENTKPHGGV